MLNFMLFPIKKPTSILIHIMVIYFSTALTRATCLFVPWLFCLLFLHPLHSWILWPHYGHTVYRENNTNCNMSICILMHVLLLCCFDEPWITALYATDIYWGMLKLHVAVFANPNFMLNVLHSTTIFKFQFWEIVSHGTVIIVLLKYFLSIILKMIKLFWLKSTASL